MKLDNSGTSGTGFGRAVDGGAALGAMDTAAATLGPARTVWLEYSSAFVSALVKIPLPKLLPISVSAMGSGGGSTLTAGRRSAVVGVGVLEHFFLLRVLVASGVEETGIIGVGIPRVDTGISGTGPAAEETGTTGEVVSGTGPAAEETGTIGVGISGIGPAEEGA